VLFMKPRIEPGPVMTAMSLKPATPRTMPMKMQNRTLVLLLRSKDTLKSWVNLEMYFGPSKDEARIPNL